jgi:hypothetical protein
MPDPLDAARRDARTFSAHLGILAGAPSGRNAGRALGGMNAAVLMQPPPRLAAVLGHFRRRDERTEYAARAMRANAFVRD